MISDQWEFYSNWQLHKRIPLVGDGEGTYTCYQVCFTGEYLGSAPLEYAVGIYDSTGNTRLYTSLYVDSGTPINVGLPLVQSTTDIVYRCDLYVRKKDGSYIYADDMYAGALTWYLNRTTEVSENNTLPAEWLETTTASVPVYTTYTTVATTVDYQGVLTTLTVPVDIRPAIATFEQIIYDVWNLHYMPFIIIFAILCGLAAWLLH